MDTFCVLPWFGREIKWHNNQTHCCLLPSNYDIDSIKSQMSNNQRPIECQKCWALEDQGITSDRQLKNAALDFYWNRDLSLIKQDALNGQSEVLMLKLFTSYTCNATCVSCNSDSSSSWQNLLKKNNIPIKDYSRKSVSLESIIQQVDLSKLKSLILVGGEPLYEKRNFELFNHLVELGNTQLFISLVTNGSVELTDGQKLILSKFKNINFCISIDGVGPVFEYIRYPLKWTQLERNLKFFKDLTDNISVCYTISNLNILYHNETIAWFKENNLPYANNPIYNPVWLQPKALPTHIKSILKQKLDPVDYSAFTEQHTNEDQTNFEKFLIEINKQDSLKNISYRDYLPELAQLINLN